LAIGLAAYSIRRKMAAMTHAGLPQCFPMDHGHEVASLGSCQQCLCCFSKFIATAADVCKTARTACKEHGLATICSKRYATAC
jgi:hypothetical protein